MIQPRDYQVLAVNNTLQYLNTMAGNPLIGLPTGTGKALVIAGLIYRIMMGNPYMRIMMLTHVKELVEQNYEELLKVWPEAPVGIHAESAGRRDVGEPIIFGSVQSVNSTIKANPGAFKGMNAIIIDEAHLVSPNAETQYQSVIGHFEGMNPSLRAVGLTATPFRMKHGLLTEGGIFEDFSLNLTGRDDFNEFIRRGYLCNLIPRTPNTQIDVSKVVISKSTGDFSLKELQAASNQERITIDAVREMLTLAADRKKWLIFGSGIEHVESIVEILSRFGVPCVYTHSKLKKWENDEAVDRFKNDPSIRAMVNADRLTTGFNAPQVDMIALLRATMSSSLHVQMLGRGTRPYPGKLNCLILDFAGNVARLGPINDPVLPRKPGSKGASQPAPIKYCEACGVMNHTSVRTCIACEAEFQFQIKFSASAGTQVVVSGLDTQVEEIEWGVKHVFYSMIMTKTKLPALRVVYACGNSTASEIICFEHNGFPKHKAHIWWRHRSTTLPPKTVEEALARVKSLPNPKTIKVQLIPGNKYPQINYVKF